MIPIIVKDLLPRVSLQEHVLKYQVFRFLFEGGSMPPIKHHYPRPEHCITFYTRDAQKFAYGDRGLIKPYPSCVINGMHTVPVHRYAGNDFLAIKAILKPASLYYLTQLAPGEITNSFVDAVDVWGNKVCSVNDQLKESRDLPTMISVIEDFLEPLIKLIRNDHPIDKAIEYLLARRNDVPIAWLADQSCLSVRQFQRKFEERMGVNFKAFKRIIRFDRAYRMKNCHPACDWSYIALENGYHDYQHMTKDFSEYAGLTPVALAEREKFAPERVFGFSYLT